MGLLVVQSSGAGDWIPAGKYAASDRGTVEGEEGKVAFVPKVADEIFHPLRGASLVQGIGKGGKEGKMEFNSK